jgi:hypothetical protein
MFHFFTSNFFNSIISLAFSLDSWILDSLREYFWLHSVRRFSRKPPPHSSVFHTTHRKILTIGTSSFFVLCGIGPLIHKVANSRPTFFKSQQTFVLRAQRGNFCGSVVDLARKNSPKYKDQIPQNNLLVLCLFSCRPPLDEGKTM